MQHNLSISAAKHRDNLLPISTLGIHWNLKVIVACTIDTFGLATLKRNYAFSFHYNTRKPLWTFLGDLRPLWFLWEWSAIQWLSTRLAPLLTIRKAVNAKTKKEGNKNMLKSKPSLKSNYDKSSLITVCVQSSAHALWSWSLLMDSITATDILQSQWLQPFTPWPWRQVMCWVVWRSFFRFSISLYLCPFSPGKVSGVSAGPAAPCFKLG